jgi:hypothetical protein
MLDWVLTVVLIWVGIVLTQTAILHNEFSDRAKGYILMAVKERLPFLMLTFVIETVIATALTVIASTKFTPLPRPLLSILIGILVVLLPNTFEYFVIYRDVDDEKIKNPLVKALKWLNLAIIRKFGGTIRTFMGQDVYDAQHGWGLGIPREEMGRRLRQIYYCHAIEIARERRDPELMRRDANFWPFEHLYLLFEHLGRERVRYEIEHPPDLEWDGSEKRHRRGTIADRKNADERTSLPPRYYDDPILNREIAAGRRGQVSAPPLLH